MAPSTRRSGSRGSRAPAVIDRFKVLRVLGAGCMGVVYLAEDPRLARKVAIKLLHAERALERRRAGTVRA